MTKPAAARWKRSFYRGTGISRASCPRLGCFRVFARGQVKEIIKNPGIVHLLLDKPQKKE
jgi:hypothetical protein